MFFHLFWSESIEEMCNPMLTVLVYLIYIVLYICNSKQFKFNLSQHVIFNNNNKKIIKDTCKLSTEGVTLSSVF